MLTSGEHLGDLARCQELGISAFLTKPIRRAELRAAILNAIADQDRGGQTAQDLRALAGKTAELTSASSGAHILLAEDNVVNQRVARAVRMGEKEPFDLILMDVQMPDLDGFEATGLIRKKEKESGTHMPIIAMTAHAMSGDRERCLDAGMDEYISKPISGPVLLDLVTKYALLQRLPVQDERH